jgi:surface polysaccharide O-acyltransferase-like enzyme
MYMTLYFKDKVQSGYLAFMMNEALRYTGWGPLWFVLSLLIFTSVYLLAVKLIRRKNTIAWPDNTHVFAFIIGIGVLTFLLRIINPLGNDLLGLQIAYFPLYIAFFIFGIQAYRGNWLNKLEERQATLWFRITLVFILALPAIFVLGGALSGQADNFRGGLTAQSLIYSRLEPFICVGISMKLLVLFRNRFNNTSPVTARLSQSAYAAYIIHPFFVVAATHLARNCSLPSLAIVLTLCPLVIITCFATANVLRQLPGLKRVL